MEVGMQQFRFAILALLLVASGTVVMAQPKTVKFGAAPIPAPVAATLPGAHTGPQTFGSAKSVDLSPFFPEPGFQGNLNSCVGWATAYAMKSYQEHVEKSARPFSKDSSAFSPSFLYNQINGGRDEGSTLSDAGALLTKIGAVPLSVMPYTDNYRAKPSDKQLSQASAWKAASFQLIRPQEIDAMKEYLRQGIPVVIGMEVRQDFVDYRSGIYKSSKGASLGGHAMCILGFDDSKQAFKLINSWSTQWGEKGYAWIDYQTFQSLNKAAMVVKDIAAPAPDAPAVPLNVQAGKGSAKDHIPVMWNEVPGAEGFAVFRSTKPDEAFVELALVRGTTYLDRGAKPGTIYYYAVKTLVGEVRSDYSEAAQGFLQVKKGMGVPRNLRAEYDGTNVRLLWSAVEDAKTYRVYRYLPEKDAFGKIGESSDPGFADATVSKKPGTWYYLVTAVGEAEEGPNSESTSAVVPEVPVRPLLSPVGLKASEGKFSDRVELAWEQTPGAQQYVILRYDDTAEVWKIMDGVKTTAWVDRKPLKQKTWYAVLARIGDNVSPLDDYVSGWISAVKSKSRSFADDSYFGSFNSTEARNGKDSWFRDDSFFTNPDSFFSDFSAQDFFFIDEEKFFYVDPDFFKVPEGFFTNADNFFGN